MMSQDIEQHFPETARIHLPVQWCFGFVLDKRMPVGRVWPEEGPEGRTAGQQLTYPFLVVENADASGSCIEIASRSPNRLDGDNSLGISTPAMVRYGRPRVRVERTRDGFTVRFQCGIDEEPTVREIPSVERVIEYHHEWLGANYGLRSIESGIESGDLPSWASHIPLVVVFDMWLANNEAAHNYLHLRDVCRDMARLGVPKGTVIYLPGWCGPYDGGYPAYEPVPELGGRSAFQEAVEAAHEAGYAVMVHTLGWGADPYRPSFERYLPLAKRNWNDPAAPPPPIVHNFQGKQPPDGSSPLQPRSDDPLRGPYTGWPGGGEYISLDWAPLQKPIGSVRPSPGGWLFTTAEVPDRCEAIVAVGGLRDIGRGVVKLTIGTRSLASPAGWFSDHDSYSFPFTFLLEAGANPVELVVYGAKGNAGGAGAGSEIALKGAWFRVEKAYGHGTKHNIWTQPAVGMDLNDPAWHEAFCEKLVPTVIDFGIDLVHIDATTLWRWDDRGMYGVLRRQLPRGTAFGTEVGTVPGFRFFLLHQTNPEFLYRASGIESPAEDSWRPKLTDLSWQITGRYAWFYGGLCEPQAFVPHRCVCTVDPMPRSLPEGYIEKTERLLLLQAEHHMIPALRLNYRDFGLDDLTRKYLQKHIIT
jgi:hypothetical protein